MRPETCAPTCTCVSGCTVPVDCTVSATSPCVTGARTYRAWGGGRVRMRQIAPAATTTRIAAQMLALRSQARCPSTAESSRSRAGASFGVVGDGTGLGPGALAGRFGAVSVA